MSTATLDAPGAAAHASTSNPADGYRLSFPRAVRAEWIKFATLRSTWWSIAITAVLTIGIALLIASAMNATGFSGINAVTSPVQFTMLLAGILGAIAVTGEYGTGTIRSTLTAVPVRGMALLAKAVVVAAAMFVASFVIFFASAVAITPLLSSEQAFDWGSMSRTWMPLLAASVSMAVFALIGLSFGYLLRSGAGAIAVTVAVLFVLPIVVGMFTMAGPDWRWIVDMGDYLPMTASAHLIFASVSTGPDAPDALPAALALAGWSAGGLLAAWGVLRTRDA